ncbi:zinc finger protein 131 isoform X1 [Lepeophtheirus salmonis]|uniref:zinc finger protein 131 isoform X1 n=1 Tax=Lepeophtheirus salmonis TaxID=72036 RepID=UPI001AE122BB|nr:modifier of mdg4-like isoform X1 [Lepeophtheirus salmonis]
MAQQEEFLLKWNEHHNSFFGMLQELCVSEFMTDVTLACGGQVFETHKLILCVCSPFFKNLLSKQRPGKHPIIFLKSVNPKHLGQLLQYMYRGEINVLQEDLGPLVETAKELQIKGLADAPDKKIPPLLSKNSKSNSSLKESLSVPQAQQQPLNSFGQIPKEPPEVIKKEWADEDEEYGEVYPEPEFMTEDPHPVLQQTNSEHQHHQHAQHSYKSEEEEEEESIEGGHGHVKMTRSSKKVGSNTHPSFCNKDLTCDVCFKQFPVPSKLNQHAIIHSGIKPYVCEICQMAFNVLGNLRRHIRTKHRQP